MMKSALTLLTASLMAASVLAASVHFKQNRNPTLIDNGLSISATGSLAGLGEGDVVVTLSATGTISATCTNLSGANQPPGQVPQPVTLSGSVAIPDEQFKNGNVGFSVTTTPPAANIPGAPDCPNANWTETITDIQFTSVTLTVQQAGQTVLTTTCTTAATTGGVVPTSAVNCTR